MIKLNGWVDLAIILLDIKIIKNNLELPDLHIGERFYLVNLFHQKIYYFLLIDRKYLITGDLGFVYNNELFINRRSNLFIILMVKIIILRILNGSFLKKI